MVGVVPLIRAVLSAFSAKTSDSPPRLLPKRCLNRRGHGGFRSGPQRNRNKGTADNSSACGRIATETTSLHPKPNPTKPFIERTTGACPSASEYGQQQLDRRLACDHS